MSKQILLSVFAAWFIAQVVLKILVASYRKNKFYPKAGILGGGMPSSHASLVTALALSMGISEGFLSPLFIIALSFGGIAIFQVLIEKKVIVGFFDQITKGKPKDTILRELGHSTLEVFVGMLVGISSVMYFFYY